MDDTIITAEHIEGSESHPMQQAEARNFRPEILNVQPEIANNTCMYYPRLSKQALLVSDTCSDKLIMMSNY